MLIRTSARGEFLACSGFPRCRNAMNLDKLEEMKVEQAKNPIVIKGRKSKKAATKET